MVVNTTYLNTAQVTLLGNKTNVTTAAVSKCTPAADEVSLLLELFSTCRNQGFQYCEPKHETSEQISICCLTNNSR